MNSEAFQSLQYADAIDFVIDCAHAAGSAKRFDEAVRWFALCRTMLVARAPADQLRARIASENRRMRAEADNARAKFKARSAADARTRVTIIADSLGLPRPEELSDLDGALDKTYTGLILAKLAATPQMNGAAMDSHCQRYFTTDDAVALMMERPEILQDADVLVHLGLNDCVVRMFLEDQRLACDLLPKPISEKVVGFARVYRAHLVKANPDHQYVPLTRFRANLARMAELFRRAGGRTLTFCTAIVVPVKFWGGTPGVCQNFGAYNQAVYEEAQRYGARVLDVDRIMWQHGNLGTLIKDGMHLSHRGHELFAEYYLKNTFGI